jgi:hypothetical protein
MTSYLTPFERKNFKHQVALEKWAKKGDLVMLLRQTPVKRAKKVGVADSCFIGVYQKLSDEERVTICMTDCVELTEGLTHGGIKTYSAQEANPDGKYEFVDFAHIRASAVGQTEVASLLLNTEAFRPYAQVVLHMHAPYALKVPAPRPAHTRNRCRTIDNQLDFAFLKDAQRI